MRWGDKPHSMYHKAGPAHPSQRAGGAIDLDYLVESVNLLAIKVALLEEQLDQDKSEALRFKEDVCAKLSLFLPPNPAQSSVVEGRAVENNLDAAAAEKIDTGGEAEKGPHQNDDAATGAISLCSANYITQLYTNFPDSVPQLPPVPAERMQQEDNVDSSDRLGVILGEDGEQSDSSLLFSSCSSPLPGPYTMPSEPLSQSFACSQSARLYSQDFPPTPLSFPSINSHFMLGRYSTATPSFLRERDRPSEQMQRTTADTMRRRSRGRLSLSTKGRRKRREICFQDESAKRKRRKLRALLSDNFYVRGAWSRVSHPRKEKKVVQEYPESEEEGRDSVDAVVEPVGAPQKQTLVPGKVDQSIIGQQQHDNIDWTIFNEFDLEFLRSFCDDERVHVPPPPDNANGNNVDALPADVARQHYLDAIYVHIEKRNAAYSQQKITDVGDKAEDNAKPSQKEREPPPKVQEAHLSTGGSQHATDQNDKEMQRTPRRSARKAPRATQCRCSEQHDKGHAGRKRKNREQGEIAPTQDGANRPKPIEPSSLAKDNQDSSAAKEQKNALQRDSNAEKRRETPSSSSSSSSKEQEERNTANTKGSSSQKASCKSANNRFVKKKRRRMPLTQQQEEAWKHIDSWERRELERMMDNNWTWRYRVRPDGSRVDKYFLSPNGIKYRSLDKAKRVLCGDLPDSLATSKLKMSALSLSSSFPGHQPSHKRKATTQLALEITSSPDVDGTRRREEELGALGRIECDSAR